jgi:hypothetical protein
MDDYEVVAEELSQPEKMRGLEERLAEVEREVERVNTRLEERP